jgi:hypothetical protein
VIHFLDWALLFADFRTYLEKPLKKCQYFCKFCKWIYCSSCHFTMVIVEQKCQLNQMLTEHHCRWALKIVELVLLLCKYRWTWQCWTKVSWIESIEASWFCNLVFIHTSSTLLMLKSSNVGFTWNVLLYSNVHEVHVWRSPTPNGGRCTHFH